MKDQMKTKKFLTDLLKVFKGYTLNESTESTSILSCSSKPKFDLNYWNNQIFPNWIL